MSDLRTNTLSVFHLPGAGDDDEGTYVSLVEHYEIIDPDLPREERFRTDHIALNINGEGWEMGQDNLLELARMFLAAGMIHGERIAVRPVSGDQEGTSG